MCSNFFFAKKSRKWWKFLQKKNYYKVKKFFKIFKRGLNKQKCSTQKNQSSSFPPWIKSHEAPKKRKSKKSLTAVQNFFTSNYNSRCCFTSLHLFNDFWKSQKICHDDVCNISTEMLLNNRRIKNCYSANRTLTWFNHILISIAELKMLQLHSDNWRAVRSKRNKTT